MKLPHIIYHLNVQFYNFSQLSIYLSFLLLLENVKCNEMKLVSHAKYLKILKIALTSERTDLCYALYTLLMD